jgi:GH35 family endo-1,4-beta-xylanase
MTSILYFLTIEFSIKFGVLYSLNILLDFTETKFGHFMKTKLLILSLLAVLINSQAQTLPQGKRLKDVNPAILVGATVQSGNDEATQLLTSNSALQTVFKREFNLGQTTAYPAWETWKGLKQYDFARFNQVVNYFYNNNILVSAHLLAGPGVYFPAWFNTGSYTNSELEGILEDYIKSAIQTNGNNTKVTYWNVANEALNWDGHYYTNAADCKLQQLGWENDLSGLTGASKVHQQHPIWVRRSLEMARKYTNKKLELRDYGTDFWDVNKSKAFYQLVKHLKNSGVPLDAVGLQGHFSLDDAANDWSKLKQAIQEYKKLGLEVYVTEIDLADKAKSWSQDKATRQQAQYKQMVQAIVEAGANWICFWGLRDNWNTSWLYNEKPLLFDESLNPKPAYYGVQEGLKSTITAVEEINMSNVPFMLYPNPFSETLYIKSEQKVAYEIYDLTGSIMEKDNVMGESMVGKMLPNGMYTIRIKSGNDETIMKIAKY